MVGSSSLLLGCVVGMDATAGAVVGLDETSDGSVSTSAGCVDGDVVGPVVGAIASLVEDFFVSIGFADESLMIVDVGFEVGSGFSISISRRRKERTELLSTSVTSLPVICCFRSIASRNFGFRLIAESRYH